MSIFWDSAWARRIENKLDLLIGSTFKQGDQEMTLLQDIKAADDALGQKLDQELQMLAEQHQMLSDALANGNVAEAQAILAKLQAQTSQIQSAIDTNPTPTP